MLGAMPKKATQFLVNNVLGSAILPTVNSLLGAIYDFNWYC